MGYRGMVGDADSGVGEVIADSPRVRSVPVAADPSEGDQSTAKVVVDWFTPYAKSKYY